MVQSFEKETQSTPGSPAGLAFTVNNAPTYVRNARNARDWVVRWNEAWNQKLVGTRRSSERATRPGRDHQLRLGLGVRWALLCGALSD